jgi:hypothetical protein
MQRHHFFCFTRAQCFTGLPKRLYTEPHSVGPPRDQQCRRRKKSKNRIDALSPRQPARMQQCCCCPTIETPRQAPQREGPPISVVSTVVTGTACSFHRANSVPRDRTEIFHGTTEANRGGPQRVGPPRSEASLEDVSVHHVF